MAGHPIFLDLKEIDIPLKNIYLDPNNPRFVGTGWKFIPDSRIDKDSIQENTRQKLIQNFGIDKLRMNMEVNGYLPIDRAIVRIFKENKYVVLEGNRRICAAKMISSFVEDGSGVSTEVVKSLKTIPCLLYTGAERDASWIFQGLRHITGVLEWSAYNKARLLVEQMEQEGLNLTEAGKKFGLTPFGAGQWVRGYYAFKQAKEASDFINEVDERAYPYFQELFSKSSAPVREWLEWDEQNREFKNQLNFNEFINWLYPREIDNDEEIEATDRLGDFERRYVLRRDDIRDIAFLIKEEPRYFEQFRKEHDLEKSYSIAQAKKYEEQAKNESDPVNEVFEAVKICTKALKDVPYRMISDDKMKTRLLKSLDALQRAISALTQ